MRTILRLCLAASLVAAVGLAAVPAAHAAKRPGAVKIDANVAQDGVNKKQNRLIRKARRKAEFAHKRISNLKDFAFGLESNNKFQQGLIDALSSTVDQLVAGVPAIVGGLQALQAAVEGPIQSALKDTEDALHAIDDALNDPVTGLVGLNLARPQFGVFLGDGDFQGGTGTVASGPSDDAFRAGPGTYVVDFGNDVSERVLSVTPFPGSVPLTASAVNCAVGAPLSPSIDGACDAAAGADALHPDLVFVLLQNSTNGAPTDNPFQVIALSG